MFIVIQSFTCTFSPAFLTFEFLKICDPERIGQDVGEAACPEVELLLRTFYPFAIVIVPGCGPTTGIKIALAVEKHPFVADRTEIRLVAGSQITGALPKNLAQFTARPLARRERFGAALVSMSGGYQVGPSGFQIIICAIGIGIVTTKLGALGDLESIKTKITCHVCHVVQIVLVETESYGIPNFVGAIAISALESTDAAHDAGPMAVSPVQVIAGLIPTIDAPVYFVAMIQYATHVAPEVHVAIAAVGDDHQGYVRIHGLEPCADIHKVSAVYGVSIVAAEGHALDVFGVFAPETAVEKLQCELAIQETVGHFGSRASRTFQCADAAELDVPVIQGQSHCISTSAE